MVVVENNLQHEEEEKHKLMENPELEPGPNGKIVQNDSQQNNDDSMPNSEPNSTSQNEKDKDVGIENSTAVKGDQKTEGKILNHIKYLEQFYQQSS